MSVLSPAAPSAHEGRNHPEHPSSAHSHGAALDAESAPAFEPEEQDGHVVPNAPEHCGWIG